MTVTPITGWERERFALWLEENPGGTLEEFFDWQVDTTPVEWGGTA